MIMPRKDGLGAISDILTENPSARILVLTSFSDDERVFPAIKAGALGYLLKDSSPQELIHAIRSTNRGEATLHPTIARMLMRQLAQPGNQVTSLPPTTDPLTGREVEVLRLVSQGLSNDEIAARLVLSERTVRTHVSHILDKLHLVNRTQMALYALREGIASLDND
jgi:NarL family two-component system response regulator LiaR